MSSLAWIEINYPLDIVILLKFNYLLFEVIFSKKKIKFIHTPVFNMGHHLPAFSVWKLFERRILREDKKNENCAQFIRNSALHIWYHLMLNTWINFVAVWKLCTIYQKLSFIWYQKPHLVSNTWKKPCSSLVGEVIFYHSLNPVE